MPDSDAQTPKLADVWGFVLLRGLIEGALAVIILVPRLHNVGPLALFVTSVLVAGSLVEVAMAHRLPGHAFRSILVFVGFSGWLIAAFILYNFFFGPDARVTSDLLIVMMGLWVAVRGFAALWLGLSIVSGTFERAVPIVAGLLGLGVGGAALFIRLESIQPLVVFLSLYGLGSVIVHVLVAFRMRRGRHRRSEEGAEARRQEASAHRRE